MAIRRLLAISIATVSLAVGLARASDSPEPSAPSNDECRIVAAAKYDQWRQQRVLIAMTKTFSDGSIKNDEIIVDGNTAYGMHRGSWNSGTMKARSAPSVTQILDAMGLDLCAKDSSVKEGARAATLYTYSYRPDADGFVAHGRIWIGDETGLPLREELKESAPPANQMVATAISATYQYGSEFEIPADAEKAESTRLFLTASSLRHAQGGFGGGAGPH
jgi:hypothetical protein